MIYLFIKSTWISISTREIKCMWKNSWHLDHKLCYGCGYKHKPAELGITNEWNRAEKLFSCAYSCQKNVTEILKGKLRVFKRCKKAEQSPNIISHSTAVSLHKQAIDFSNVGKVAELSARNYDPHSFKTLSLVIWHSGKKSVAHEYPPCSRPEAFMIFWHEMFYF